MTRIFVGQGSLHILTAIVAGEACSGRAVPAAGDVLLFHGLHPHREESSKWASILDRAARRLGEWQAVIFLTQEQIEGWTHAAALRGWKPIASELRAVIGADTVAEIYIQRNPDFINRLIVAAYPGARRICYGDGMGVNYSERYWLPDARSSTGEAVGLSSSPIRSRFHGLRRAAQWARRVVRAAGAIPSLRRRGPEAADGSPEAEPPPARFDRHCLLLPNCFDDFVEDPLVLEARKLREKLDAWIPCLAEGSGRTPASAQLAAEVAGARESLILLPSCFSEAGRIDPESEIAAYIEVVDELAPGDDTLLILKPHPRDSLEKTRELRAELDRQGRRVHLLDDPHSRFLPFELTLRLAFGPPTGAPRRFATFSSACLALELLYGERTDLGFGEERVRRYFRPDYVERRLIHERDLRRAIARIRADRSG